MENWRSEYPFESNFLEVGAGIRMHYLDEGPRTDEAVLMLHGNPTWSFLFRNVVLALRGRMRCIVPDHVGMGLSDKPEDYPYRLERRVADIQKLIAHLGLKRIHLVVHDWGGAIGMGVATRAADITGKIVLMNTAAFPDVNIPGRIALCRSRVLGALIVRGLNGFVRPATTMTVTKPLSPAVRAGYLAPYPNWSSRVAVHGFIRDIPMEQDHPSRAIMQQISTDLAWLRAKPILIGWGGHDFCFTEHFLNRWKSVCSHAEIEYYANAGHYVLEDAGDKLIPRIAEFLAR
ncbi:MAG: alpha/beta fold hydrolase [Opitutaceae bacterium]|nr:alpha/beta fold hydrolase [Opitutaceae bacterium]